MIVNGEHYRTVWPEKKILCMINQLVLPYKFEIIRLNDYRETANAIKNMTVRGAGAIGATAGYAMAQALMQGINVEEASNTIKGTRPTAQNLFYAVERVRKAFLEKNKEEDAVKEANAIANEDANSCESIGNYGSKLLNNGTKMLTHCNAGWLAFVDWGSALSPVYKAKREGKKVFVFVDETRPRLQGAKLTAWELGQEQIEHRIIADNAAGYFMKKGEVDIVITGADRIAANGDTANKIGTYEKAVLAKENGIPFYVAAPTSTFDINCKSGDNIPIEERGEEEVLYVYGNNEKSELSKVSISFNGGRASNPAFDVTPAKYITGLITEKGIVKANNKGIKSLFKD